MLITTSENDIKERLSIAFVTAVAAHAGCQVAHWNIDKTSVDGTIRPVSGSRACVDVQVKATSADLVDGTSVGFDLPVKNFDDLRKTPQTHPHYLVILHLPGPFPGWLRMTNEELAIRGAAHWANLVGLTESQNLKTVRVWMPAAQRFTPGVLTHMIESAPSRIGGPGK